MSDTLTAALLDLADTARLTAEVLGPQLAHASAMVRRTLEGGGTLLFCGNGGSAADAQHMATEYVVRYMQNRRAYSAIALTTDTSILTAIGNDYGYEQVFARQIEGLGAAGDLFVAISTSGNSPNIVLGIEAAKRKGLRVVGLTGEKGGKMKALCDVCLCVPSSETPRIQEAHILLGHLLCAHIESELFPKTP